MLLTRADLNNLIDSRKYIQMLGTIPFKIQESFKRRFPTSHRFIVIAIFFITSLLLLGLSDIFQVSEAREGSVVRAILDDNLWALPLRSAYALPSKPPLFHWVGAAISTVTGVYNEFYLRLPSLFAALGTLILVSNYALKVAGPVAGVFAPAILSTIYGFSRLASDGRVDMLFCFFITAGTLAGLKGVNEKLSSGDRLKISALSGLAAMSKGPTGLILPIIIILVARIMLKGRSAFKEFIGFEWLLAPFIITPWYITAFIQAGESFFSRQIIFENFTRFIGGDGIASKNFWFYLPHIFGQGAPWSVLFVFYIFILGKKSLGPSWKFNRENKFLPKDKKVSQAILNSLIWFFTILLFLFLSAGKRRAYLLLCLPSMALVLSLRFSTALEQLGYTSGLPTLIKKHRYQLLSCGILVALIGLLPGLILFGIDAPKSIMWIAPGLWSALTNLSMVAQKGGIVLLAIFVILSISSLYFWILGGLKCRPRSMGYALVLFFTLTITFYTQCWLTYKSSTHSYKPIGIKLASLIPENTQLNLIKETSDESFDVLLFYYGRGVKLFDPKKNPTLPGLYLTRREWVENYRFPNFRKILTANRPVDKPGAEIELIEIY